MNYVYSEYKNEGITSTEQMCECKLNKKEETDSMFNPYECTMLNDFELYSIHAESAAIEK